MAFTFAHPAAVIGLHKQKNRFHFTALVLGSMAPDFEYFLHVKPLQVSGHSLLGLLTTNLPWVFVVWLIYEAFVRDALLRYLPDPIWKGAQQYRRAPRYIRHGREALQFVYSALIGMLTHIIWDSFTHQSGRMVGLIPFLQKSLTLFGRQVPLYKILQHGSTVIGFLAIGLFLYAKLKSESYPVRSCKERGMAWFYWGAVLILSGLLFAGFTLCFFDGSIGGLVMRILDSVLLGIVMVSMVDRILGRELDVFFWGKEKEDGLKFKR